MTDPSEETPTPRLTDTWSFTAARAGDIARRAMVLASEKGRVGAALDPHGSQLLRQIQQTAGWYQRAFARWATCSISLEQKQYELRGFNRFSAWALPELGDTE